MDAVVSSNETLIDALGLRIRTYKKEHPNLSGAQIAKRFNMTGSSFNRIENGDVRVPTIDQVLKILRGTGATGDILKYLDAHYPQIAETYREVYDTRNTEFISTDLEFYLSDNDKFLIILLALTGSGTSREEILNEFGNRGLTELDYLLSKNLLIEVDGVIGKNDKTLNASPQTLVKLLSMTVGSCFSTDVVHLGENYLTYKTININKEKDQTVKNNLSKSIHEFKTPLLSIISLSKDLSNSKSLKEIKENIDKIENLCNYSLFLTSDLTHSLLNKELLIEKKEID